MIRTAVPDEKTIEQNAARADPLRSFLSYTKIHRF